MGKYYWPVRGGIENYEYHLCTRLTRFADVRMICSNTNRRTVRETVDGVDVLRVGRYGVVASTPLCPGMPRRLNGTDADIIHIHLPNPTAEVSYLLARPRGKLVVSYHSDVVKQKLLFRCYRAVNDAFLSRASRIIAAAPQNVDHSPVLSRFRDRTRIISYGVEPRDFQLTPQRKRRVRELRERFGNRIIFFVGRLVYYKGVEFLVRAMQHVDAHAVIGSEGPMKDELQQLARDLDVARKVTFAGNIPNEDLPCYYHAAAAFCLPSIARSEAFGIVQLEAMACGVPVVSTRLDSGVVFVNQDGVTGLTVPPQDPGALAAALNRLLEDEALRRKLGGQGRDRVRREFTHDITVNKTLAVYDEALGETRAMFNPSHVAVVSAKQYSTR